MFNYSHISAEEASRVLDFLNKATSIDDIIDPNTLFDDPSSGLGDQVNDPTMGSLVAMRILDKRDTCPGKVFTKLEQLDDIQGFGQDKLQDLVFSLNKREVYKKDKTRSIYIPVLSTGGNTPTVPPEIPPYSLYGGGGEDAENIKLEDKDIGNLEKVLRSYYRSQINTLEGRKDRNLARELIEDHLVLPKSQQRTSKDGAYIKEKLGIEGFLLERLEDTRLIRKISRRGINPIYEVSHDTLVEPILAERREKEMFGAFIKKWWKGLTLLLLLFFAFGIILENCENIIPSTPITGKTVDIGSVKVFWQKEDCRETIFIPDSIREELWNAEFLSLGLEMKPKVQNPRTIDSQGQTMKTMVYFSDTIYLDSSFLRIKEGTQKSTTKFIRKIVPSISYKRVAGISPEFYNTKADVSEHLTIIFTDDSSYVPVDTPDLPFNPIEINLSNETSPLVIHRDSETFTINISEEMSSYLTGDPQHESVKNLFENLNIKVLYTQHAKPRYIYNEVGGNIRLDPEGAAIEFTTKGKKLYTQQPFSPWSSPRGNLRVAQVQVQKGPVHTVQAGETLYSIANAYGISVNELKRINNLKSNKLKLNQELEKPN